MVLINLKTQNMTCMQKPRKTKPKTHNTIHNTMCHNGTCTKHKKHNNKHVYFKISNHQIFLRTHDLGLYPTHEINWTLFKFEPIHNTINYI
jgi:hypothetical protein